MKIVINIFAPITLIVGTIFCIKGLVAWETFSLIILSHVVLKVKVWER